MEDLKLNKKIAIRKVQDTYIILTMDNVMHKIEDPVGVFILDLFMDEKCSNFEQIWQQVTDNFDVSSDPDSAKASVIDFLNTMNKKGIIGQ